MASVPLSLRAYRCAMTAVAPFAPLVLRRRARRGKENAGRLSERLGFASLARPNGTLVWIHGASVGETLSVLSLIDLLLETPDVSVLVTSGTVASAELMAQRLPPRAFHQFAPIDTPSAVARFLEHWRPDVGLFVDSEIWPNLLLTANARGTRLAVVNGRMSEKSFRGWRKAKRTAASLMSLFDVCLTADAETSARLKALGARDVRTAGSLKADSPPLAAEPGALADLRGRIGARPVLLATNTHGGEEELVLSVHDRLRAHFPGLLTIIAPRHVERGAEIAGLAGSRTHARRALAQGIAEATEIYVADTMGELGLFYRAAAFAFIGKSLVEHGGHNPIEPARLGVAVVAGPHTENFQEAFAAIFAAQGVGLVHSADELAALAEQFLRDPARTREIGKAAERAVLPLGGALAQTRRAVEDMLGRHART